MKFIWLTDVDSGHRYWINLDHMIAINSLDYKGGEYNDLYDVILVGMSIRIGPEGLGYIAGAVE